MNAIVALCALLCLVAGSFPQIQPVDNSKIPFLAAEWVIKEAFQGEGETDAAITGSKNLRERFVRPDLTFESQHAGKVQAMALLTGGEDGVIRGYFFSSEKTNPLGACGQLKDKKLAFTGTPSEGGGEVRVIFPITSPDALSCEIYGVGGETMFRAPLTKEKAA